MPAPKYFGINGMRKDFASRVFTEITAGQSTVLRKQHQGAEGRACDLGCGEWLCLRNEWLVCAVMTVDWFSLSGPPNPLPFFFLSSFLGLNIATGPGHSVLNIKSVRTTAFPSPVCTCPISMIFRPQLLHTTPVLVLVKHQEVPIQASRGQTSFLHSLGFMFY